MKRAITLILVLLLAVVPALAESADFSTFDYFYGHAGSRLLYYGFPDITLYMPIDWEGRITIQRNRDGVAFFQSASYDKFLEQRVPNGGFLFELRACEDERFRELPAFAYLGYSENAALHFYLLLPSDCPAWPEDEAIMAEYDEMAGQIDEIVEQARIEPNMSFFTEGLISTDPGMS